MPITYTPLRYPGGKSSIYPFVSDLIRQEGYGGRTYVEPFAGGAGLAVKLLLRGDVPRIHLNDLDPAIFHFWESTVYRTEELCRKIELVPVTIEEWHRQQKIARDRDSATPLTFALATLFLNRTNVSGVLTGGVIGGLAQRGTNAMDVRFNKADLIRKIRAIGARRADIRVSGLDATYLIEDEVFDSNSFMNIDPPYVKKGPMLYRNSFSIRDHLNLRDAILTLNVPWMLTYDDSPFIRSAYSRWNANTLPIYYSIGKVRKATEVVFFADQKSPSTIISKENLDHAAG